MARDKYTALSNESSLRAWLPFLFYAMVSVTLMLVDGRFSLGSDIRAQSSRMLSPLWWLAAQPNAVWQSGVQAFKQNSALREQVETLQSRQLKSDLALQQLLATQAENTELRRLLNAQQRMAPKARLAELVNSVPDPSQKRFVINKGSRDGIGVGQVVIDAYGLVGQVAEVYAGTALVISVLDADHAVPVMVARSGFRSILIGQGNDRHLLLANLTQSDDVKIGDVLITSGVGGRFPPGLPVGIVQVFQQDPALTYISAQVTPIARLGYGRSLLLLEPMANAPASTDAAGNGKEILP